MQASTAAWLPVPQAGLPASSGIAQKEEQRYEALANYELVDLLGEGTFGKVYKAVHRETNKPYAVKIIKIRYEDEGVPSTAIREVSLLKECNHPNVIRLHQVFYSPARLGLVFEFLDMDLRLFLKKQGPFTDPPWLQSAVHQCFCGIEFCHGHRILHRDLKPQNVLVDVGTHRLKLADFGLARAFTVPLRAYTHEVVTLWYRAPEILLGQSRYATPMDIWSLGCVVAEMATGQALFPGDSEIGTLFRIFKILGTPTDEIWPGVSSLREFKQEFPKWQDTQLMDLRTDGPALGSTGVELLRECLKYNPIQRLSARKVLQHAFFDTQEENLLGCAAVDAEKMGR